MEQQSQFEGWAILEIFGHQKYAGFVKTEYYGTACMFRCDIPPLEERLRVSRSGCRVQESPDDPSLFTYCPPGSTVKLSATQGYSKLFGVGAVYSITPCDQEAAIKAVEELQPRSLMLVSLPKGKTIAAGLPADIPPKEGFDCCGGDLVYGHEIGCPSNDGGEDPDDDD